MKDDTRSKRLLTSRTEVNVERIRQLVCGDSWLNVRMLAGQLFMKKFRAKTANDDKKKHCTHVCQDVIDDLHTEADLFGSHH